MGSRPLKWWRLEGMTAVSPDRRWLACAPPKGAITVFELNQPQVRHVLSKSDISESELGFSPDSRLLLAQRSSTHLVAFDTVTWKEAAVIATPGAVEGWISFCFDARSQILAV